MTTPYTEQSHPESVAIDTASPHELAAIMMHEMDIFTGWKGAQGILGDETLEKISAIQQTLSHVLQDSENCSVVLAGCGTSGRLAFMTARAVNARLLQAGKVPCVRYLIAGHDIALFKSQEGYEDDPIAGQQVLEKAAAGRKHVLYVGITCGLSAPFIAGQLDLCLKHPDRFTPVLVAFNPVHMARSLPIEKWNKTFLEVAERILEEQRKGKAFILNPTIGPELVTGSTRMKAGSATKVLLDMIFAPTHQGAPLTLLRTHSNHLLAAYRGALYAVHKHDNDDILGRIIEMAALSLRSGGHLYYLGDAHLGLVGLIDASECSPTYGAGFDDVRGFIDGGYATLQNEEGDISYKVGIGIDYFVKTKLPETTSTDLVIVLVKEGDISFVPDMSHHQCRTVAINIHTTPNKTMSAAEASCFVAVLNVDLAGSVGGAGPDLEQCLRISLPELAAKWVCNALSTGAHIRIGKVYGNLMVDVNVSNDKLFVRAVRIIKTLVECSQDEARYLLLRAIYMSDNVTELTSRQPISRHLEVAATKSQIVPLALVLGMHACTVDEAAGYLRKFPIVRQAIAAHRK